LVLQTAVKQSTTGAGTLAIGGGVFWGTDCSCVRAVATVHLQMLTL